MNKRETMAILENVSNACIYNMKRSARIKRCADQKTFYWHVSNTIKLVNDSVHKKADSCIAVEHLAKSDAFANFF